jgi:uncharacterized protein (DUF1800 family)
MRIARRNAALLVLIFALAAFTTGILANDKGHKNKTAASQMDEHQRALQALNRLTFGPRPGDVARVEQIGIDKWIEQQLHPEKINDSALDSRLSGYRTLRMNTREMVEQFPPPQLVKAVMDGKLPMPSDPERRAIYQSQIARLQEKKEQKQNADENTMQQAGPELREAREFARQRADSLLQLPPDQRYREILNMNPDDRMIVAQRIPQPERLRLVAGMSPEQRETIVALANPIAVVQSEVSDAKLLRAIYSERQLEEVMTDFWFNHFNVFIGKGADRYLITSYERDAIRPHALGKFQDLLLATAKNPAMLFYLDNWLSIGPDSQFALYGPQSRPQMRPRPWPRRSVIFAPFPLPPSRPIRPRPQNAKKKAQSGINENYARELMELQTLGVNGGYTQQDVIQVARVFTGWTLKEPRRGGGFEFDERKHEPGTKYVLGHEINSNGEEEGEQVLKILAHSPATARFISTELAQRFVSDNPPPPLIDRMAHTFLKKDGDIREVLRTMFHSPEFWSPEAYRARVKTPLEFVASAVRASNADVTDPTALLGALNRMGMPLYGAQPPTGYKTASEVWVNSTDLLNRMNFALALAANKLPGLTIPSDLLGGRNADGAAPFPEAESANEAELVAQLEQSLLDGDVSPHTHQTILDELNSPQMGRAPLVPLITGLLLGSPEFQRK